MTPPTEKRPATTDLAGSSTADTTVSKTPAPSPEERKAAARQTQATAKRQESTQKPPSGTQTRSPLTGRPRPSAEPASPLRAAQTPQTPSTPPDEDEPTATEVAAERGAPPPRVPAEVREAQESVLRSQPSTDELDLSDYEISNLTIRNEVRREGDGGVTALRCEHRDGRFVEISAGDGMLDFRLTT